MVGVISRDDWLDWLDAFERGLVEERKLVTDLLFEMWVKGRQHLRTGDYTSLGMAAQDLLQWVERP